MEGVRETICTRCKKRRVCRYTAILIASKEIADKAIRQLTEDNDADFISLSVVCREHEENKVTR